MAASDVVINVDSPQQADLDKCVHCGLCLNACPTYRELRVEMDSPRGRIYQMAQVASGTVEIGPSYIEHIDLCLACRGCETACPSGVQYGRLVEAARAEIETKVQRPWRERLVRWLVFRKLLPSRRNLEIAGALLYLYQASGLKRLAGLPGFLPARLRELETLAPEMETPFFFAYYGKTLPAEGERRQRVAFLGGCIANISFARLNEATVRVLQKNGCEVAIPAGQGCCGALHLHSGLRADAQKLARRNIDALENGGYKAIITNASGCGCALKEYGELLAADPQYSAKAHAFAALMRDVTEFLAGIELNREMTPVNAVVTYQDSCHLAHGQRVRTAPRKLLAAIPGIEFREMRGADICCGSAGIYNVLQNEMSMQVLGSKMKSVNTTDAGIITTANPGCMLQLEAGVRVHGKGQKV